MTSRVEKIVRRIHHPALTRVWMEGNLKWALAVAALLLAGFVLLALAWFFLSALLWFGALVLFLTAAFAYLCTGLKRGLFLQPLWCAPAAGNAIILTFDDGPHPEHTPRILDALAEAGAPAVFFLTGVQVRRHPDIVRRIEAAGHEIGCHSYSHRNLRWAGPRRMREELTLFEQEMSRMSIMPPRIFRPPNGAKSPIVEWVLRTRGYHLVHWTLSPKDWKRGTSPEEVLERLKEHTRPGSIILLHDSANAAALLPDFIRWASERDLRFVHLREFMRP